LSTADKLSRRGFLGAAGAAGILAQRRAGGVSRGGAAHFDTVVAGAGSGGIGAALAASRQGRKVLLLEIAEGIGGTAARAGVSMWEPGAGGTGIPFDIYRALLPRREAVSVYSFGRHMSWNGFEAFPGGEHLPDPDRCYRETLRRHGGTSEAFRRENLHGVVFEPAQYVKAVRNLLFETGNCILRTKTTFREVEHADGRITSMTLTDGTRITADAFIDATGSGALCRVCGCAMMTGQEGRNRFGEPSAAEKANARVNGVTLIFRVRPARDAAVEPLPQGVPEQCWWQNRFPVISATKYPCGDCNCNMLPAMEGLEYLRLGREKAMAECRRRVFAEWHYIQQDWPEFQWYRLHWIAPAMGIRESSRAVTEYILTEHDLIAGLSKQTHPDIVTIADHARDRHGAGGGCGEVAEPYGVPYRCLIPKGMKNLLVACRGAGFSSIAASSCRLSRTIMQIGQAAGTAAAIAGEEKSDLPDVPPDRLQDRLRQAHAQLAWPLEKAIREHLDSAC
jgi:hypothetical protein